MKSPKKILITGSAGFIGYHLCKRLLVSGNNVIGIDNLNDYYDPKLKESRLKILRDVASQKKAKTGKANVVTQHYQLVGPLTRQRH